MMDTMGFQRGRGGTCISVCAVPTVGVCSRFCSATLWTKQTTAYTSESVAGAVEQWFAFISCWLVSLSFCFQRREDFEKVSTDEAKYSLSVCPSPAISQTEPVKR